MSIYWHHKFREQLLCLTIMVHRQGGVSAYHLFSPRLESLHGCYRHARKLLVAFHLRQMSDRMHFKICSSFVWRDYYSFMHKCVNKSVDGTLSCCIWMVRWKCSFEQWNIAFLGLKEQFVCKSTSLQLVFIFLFLCSYEHFFFFFNRWYYDYLNIEWIYFCVRLSAVVLFDSP